MLDPQEAEGVLLIASLIITIILAVKTRAPRLTVVHVGCIVFTALYGWVGCYVFRTAHPALDVAEMALIQLMFIATGIRFAYPEVPPTRLSHMRRRDRLAAEVLSREQLHFIGLRDLCDERTLRKVTDSALLASLSRLMGWGLVERVGKEAPGCETKSFYRLTPEGEKVVSS